MSLVKSTSAIVKSDPAFGKSVAKGSIAVGGGGLALTAVAALIPFVGVFGLSIVLILAGLAFFLFGK